MKIRSRAIKLADDLEKDVALAMLIEKRLSEKIGSRRARDLIEKVKGVLTEHAADQVPPDLVGGFPSQ